MQVDGGNYGVATLSENKSHTKKLPVKMATWFSFSTFLSTYNFWMFYLVTCVIGVRPPIDEIKTTDPPLKTKK